MHSRSFASRAAVQRNDGLAPENAGRFQPSARNSENDQFQVSSNRTGASISSDTTVYSPGTQVDNAHEVRVSDERQLSAPINPGDRCRPQYRNVRGEAGRVVPRPRRHAPSMRDPWSASSILEATRDMDEDQSREYISGRLDGLEHQSQT